MSQANLSETLFKPRFKHPETSTLVRRFNTGAQQPIQSALSGNHVDHWYRLINRLMWIWRGVTPQEILDVQARIVMSESERTDSDLYDTVVGYRGGNWIYEWSKQAMLWQQKAGQEEDSTLSGKHWLHAANLYSIAAYPHLKGDELAEQAQAVGQHAEHMRCTAQRVAVLQAVQRRQRLGHGQVLAQPGSNLDLARVRFGGE